MLLVPKTRRSLSAAGSRERFILIGPTPPPLGGVSVYVSRLARKLTSEGHHVEVFNLAEAHGLKKLLLSARILLDPRRTTIQLHAFDFSAMALMSLRPFPKKLHYLDHNTAIFKRKLSFIRRSLFQRILTHAHDVAFVDEKAIQYYRSSGFDIRPDVGLRNPFLPPDRSDESRILSTYDDATKRFLAERSPVLVANASAIVFYDDVELYGLDMCIELTHRLKSDFPEIGFLFAIANADINREYIDQMRQRIEALGLSENFHFLTGQRELWPTFRMADLMVRPTSGDGYGVSLAEAVHLGCDALASDVTARPEQTRLFRSRDMDHFYESARDMLFRSMGKQ